jgi:hypothetical protein
MIWLLEIEFSLHLACIESVLVNCISKPYELARACIWPSYSNPEQSEPIVSPQGQSTAAQKTTGFSWSLRCLPLA